jgi:bis(5'-nucleosyl)-tetraphosphatase (symmetrical)
VATYVVGDVQGCFASLCALLAKVGFGAPDRLWLAGDLVNRGPASLETLRFVRALGARARIVLGNHDLHLIACAMGAGRNKGKDTLADILRADERVELIDWLRRQPLLHHEGGWTLVHAGIAPAWDLATAIGCASELSEVLTGPDIEQFLAQMYGDGPVHWSPDLGGAERLRFITNVFTRMRYVTADGALSLAEKGPPQTESDELSPWFAVADRATRSDKIMFGHWATLQVIAPVDPCFKVFPLDSGCVWGRELTALRLEDERIFTVPAVETQ